MLRIPTRHQQRAKKTSRLRELDKFIDDAQLDLFTFAKPRNITEGEEVADRTFTGARVALVQPFGNAHLIDV